MIRITPAHGLLGLAALLAGCAGAPMQSADTAAVTACPAGAVCSSVPVCGRKTYDVSWDAGCAGCGSYPVSYRGRETACDDTRVEYRLLPQSGGQ